MERDGGLERAKEEGERESERESREKGRKRDWEKGFGMGKHAVKR